MSRLWHFLSGVIRFKGRVKQGRRLVAVAAGAVLLMFLPVVIWQLTAPSRQAEATWFDGSYGYRQLTSFGNTGSADSNKKVKFDIDTATLITAGKLQSDCDDLRFTDYNGKALRFYLDTAGGACNTNSTDFYVLLETIYSGTTTLFMYYGNPSAGFGGENQQFSENTFTPTSGPSYGSEAVTPGPVAYWALDDGQGQTAQDASSNNYDGTLGATSGSSTDDPTWMTEDQCVSGKCLRFDGNNDYLNFDSVAANFPYGSSAVTIAGWYKFDTFSTALTTFFAYGGNDDNHGYFLMADQTTGILNFQVGTQGLTSPTKAATLNKWHYIVATVDATAKKIYLDGVLVGTGIGNNNILPATHFWLGNEYNRSYFFKGSMDELKVYPYARSAAQIQADYNAGAAKLGAGNQKYLSDGLVGYWKMDESSGDATDSSGRGNSLTNSASTTYLGGKFGNGSEHVPASSQHFSTATTVPGVKTVSFWTNPDSTTNYYLSLTSGAYVTSTAGTLSATGFTSPTIYVNGVQSTTIIADTWQLVTITSETPLDANQFFVGRQSSNYFDGTLDEIRLYNHSLNPAEIADLYNYAPGPVGHWKFDEDTYTNDCSTDTAFDSSTQANNADSCPNGSGSTSTAAGKYGKAAMFDGTDDYLNVAHSTTLQASAITAEAWVKPYDNNGGTILLKDTNGLGGHYSYALWVNSGTYSARSKHGTTIFDAITTIAPTVNRWTHLALVTEANSLKLYVDGTLQQTTVASGAITYGDYPLSIGNFYGNPSAGSGFNGLIDDVLIYSYARTPEQIIQDMQGDAPPDVSGQKLPDPVAYYALDNQQGQIANNSGTGGSTLNGILGANTGSSTDDPTWKTSTDCKSNGCASFDGGDFIDLGDLASTESVSQLTVSTWVYDTSYSSGTCFVCKFNHANTQTSWNLQAYNTNAVLVALPATTTDGGTYGYTANNTLTSSTWNHVVMVFDGTQIGNSNRLKVYVNGRQQTLTFAGTVPATTMATTSNARLGATPDGARYLSGLLDEVRIYTAALTNDQVLLDMNAGLSLNFGFTASSQASLLASGAGNPPILQLDFDEKQDNTCAGGTNDVCDRSGNKNDGALNNGPTWVIGKYCSAIYLDGTDDNITTGNTNFNATEGTFEAWVKPNFSSSSPPLSFNVITQIGTSSNGLQLAYSTTNGFYCYLMNGFRCQSGPISFSANTWIHLAMDWNFTTDIYNLSVNGNKVSTSTSALNAPSLSTIVLGNSGGSWMWKGAMDEVKIYPYVRSGAQIAYDYNRGAPVAHWNFDECQGSTINDQSGNNNTGTLTATATGGNTNGIGSCTTSTSVWGSGAAGKFNSSLNLDGNGDYVTVADSSSVSLTGDLTFAAWVKIDNYSQGHGLLGKTNANIANPYDWYITDTSGKMRFFGGNGAGWGPYLETSSAVPTGSWQHVAVTIENNVATGYINGVASGSVNIYSATYPRVDGNQSLRIGSRADSATMFKGQIDDVRMYNYALSPSQLKQVMNEGMAVRFGLSAGTP